MEDMLKIKWRKYSKEVSATFWEEERTLKKKMAMEVKEQTFRKYNWQDWGSPTENCRQEKKQPEGYTEKRGD